MTKTKRFLLAVFLILLLSAGYEYYVYRWSQHIEGPAIRVDIFLIYPVIIGIGALTYYLLGKIKK